MTDRKGQCQHCNQPRFIIARGLCKRCHRDREVRERYDCDYTYLSDIDPEGPRPQPATPTEYAPGTEEKLRVLAERFARMDDLWHPEDAGFTSGNGQSIACKPRRRKLTDVMVLTIRQLAAQGQSSRAIAKLLGISPASVFDVRVGRSWRHVKGATG